MIQITLDKGKPKLFAVSWKELEAHRFPPEEHVVYPWLKNGESALIWAASGVGKTWLTLSLAVSIAGGGKVWEWSSPKPRKVLYIDGEMAGRDVQKRVRKLQDEGGVKDFDADALRSNFHLMARQMQDPRARFIDITDEASQRLVMTTCEANGIEVVVIDNLTTVADGLNDENDATAFKSVMAFLMSLKQGGRTVLLVHHARKDGADVRGSTALEATFEIKLGLKRPETKAADVANFVTDFGKNRNPEGRHLVQPREWLLTDQGWHVKVDEEGTVGQLMRALKSAEYVNQTEIAVALGVSQGTVSRTLRKAIAQGLTNPQGIETAYLKAAEFRRGVAEDEGPGPFGDDPAPTSGDAF